jgi:hypothetical protein
MIRGTLDWAAQHGLAAARFARIGYGSIKMKLALAAAEAQIVSRTANKSTLRPAL